MGKCEHVMYRWNGPGKGRTRMDCPNDATQTLERVDSTYRDLNGPITVCDKCAEIVTLQNEVNGLRVRGEL